MKIVKKISVEKYSEDLVWSMANFKAVPEGGMEQWCPSLESDEGKHQRRARLVKSMTVSYCYHLLIMWRRHVTGQLEGQCVRRWEERETIYFFGKQENKTKLTMGPAQAREAWRKMRRVLGKKVEVKEASAVKNHKSLLFEIENKSGHNNYFGRKMRALKSKKRINRKNCILLCYQFLLSNTRIISFALSRALPSKQSSPDIESRQR